MEIELIKQKLEENCFDELSKKGFGYSVSKKIVKKFSRSCEELKLLLELIK